MFNREVFSGDFGAAIFDFNNKTVEFNRQLWGSVAVAENKFPEMTVKFSDITDVEVKKPGFLSKPAFCLIINGKRLLTSTNAIATHIVLDKEKFNSLVCVLQQLIDECNLCGVKEFGSTKVPTEIVDSEKFSTFGQRFVYDSLSMKIKDGYIHFGNEKKIRISSIVSSGSSMSYLENVGLRTVKMRFEIGSDIYIVEGRTFIGDKYISFAEYFKTVVRQSGMSDEDKQIAIDAMQFEGEDIAACIAIRQLENSVSSKTEKDASVIGRAVVG